VCVHRKYDCLASCDKGNVISIVHNFGLA
jgi:hypothetical protein